MNAALNWPPGVSRSCWLKKRTLGGFARNLHHTIEGGDIPAYLEKLIAEVTADEIELLTERPSPGSKVTRAISRPRSPMRPAMSAPSTTA
jgi:hypothetical protein